MSNRQSAAPAGMLLLIAGAAVDSTSGLFSRLLSADGFTTASGRGFFAFVILFAALAWRDRRAAFASLSGVGLAGLAFVLLNASGMVMNMLSLKFTAVANFFMIFATAPFVAALAGRIFLGERLDTATFLAAAAGLVGIAVMMASAAASNGLVGDLLALACVFTYSGIVLVVRRNPGLDMLPVLTLTVLASGLIPLPFASFGSLPDRDWAILAVFGFFQLALGNLLIFAGVARIPAAQAGLLGILIAAFAPVWVLVFLGEIPPRATMIGGAIVLGSSAAHFLWSLHHARRGGKVAEMPVAIE
ncbi:MAG: DMT family transporter [Hyphomicrobiales bacterium]